MNGETVVQTMHKYGRNFYQESFSCRVVSCLSEKAVVNKKKTSGNTGHDQKTQMSAVAFIVQQLDMPAITAADSLLLQHRQLANEHHRALSHFTLISLPESERMTESQ